jgi:hypothetical protein
MNRQPNSCILPPPPSHFVVEDIKRNTKIRTGRTIDAATYTICILLIKNAEADYFYPKLFLSHKVLIKQ